MASRETYLREIYELTDGGEEGTSTSELSKILDVSDASASEAVKKMEEDSLICRVPYRGFTLSPFGKEKAEELQKKYNVLESFFKNIGVEEPDEEARRLEKEISDDAVEKIKEFGED